MALYFILHKYCPNIRMDVMKDHVYNVNLMHFSTLSFPFRSYPTISDFGDILFKSKYENKNLSN